jgi:hypothetical protein
LGSKSLRVVDFASRFVLSIKSNFKFCTFSNYYESQCKINSSKRLWTQFLIQRVLNLSHLLLWKGCAIWSLIIVLKIFITTNQIDSVWSISRIRGGCRILVRGQLSDCNSLSRSNPLTNRVLNKKIIIIYIFLPNKKILK